MGITQEVYNSFLKSYLDKADRILELGAQEYIISGTRVGYFKNVFPYDITTIDITGENWSLPINLAEPITHQDKYDLITNFGTSEHVSNQYECWKNIHSLCTFGGYVISEIPEKGSWKGHCKFYVDKSFFESMAQDFEILEYRTILYPDQGNLCFCIFKKVSDEFKTRQDEFEKTILIEDYFDAQGV